MSRTVRGKTLGIQEPFVSHRWDEWVWHCRPNHTKAGWRRRQARGQHRDADATALACRPPLPSRLDRPDSGSGRETDINDLCCPQLISQRLFTDRCARRIGRRGVATSQSQPNQSTSRMISRRNPWPHPPTSSATVGGSVEPRGWANKERAGVPVAARGTCQRASALGLGPSRGTLQGRDGGRGNEAYQKRRTGGPTLATQPYASRSRQGTPSAPRRPPHTARETG